jgi:hypothetical protein
MTHQKCQRRSADSGTIILETMIAAAVIAAILGAYFMTLTQSARQVGIAEQRRIEYRIAQSQMVAANIDQRLVTGTVSGVRQGYGWRTTVTPLPGIRQESAAGRLVSVAVTVWPQNNPASRVTLESVRLMPSGLQ